MFLFFIFKNYRALTRLGRLDYLDHPVYPNHQGSTHYKSEPHRDVPAK